MKNQNRRIAVAALVLAASVGLAQSVQAECTSRDKIYEVERLGGTRTRFSPTAATSVENLQAQFETYRADLETVLRESGWRGNPEDLFKAVRNARPGDGVISARQVAPGEAFQWMAFRKGGKPACVQNVRWAGKKPFAAWTIQFESADAVHTFVVPEICLNIAFAGSKPVERPDPPTCSLTARQESCEPRKVSVKATGNYTSIKLTGLSTPAGSGDASQVGSSGAGSWTYAPATDGSYSFTAEVTNEAGETASCTTKIAVDCPDPVCALNAVYDAESGQIRLDASGGRGETTVTGVTLPDGSAGDTGALVAAGSGAWTFDTAGSLPRKSGDYTYGFSAETTLSGETASCRAQATATVERKTGWILRGWGGPLNAKGDRVDTFAARPSDGFINQHRAFLLDSGTGYGADIEYRFNRRLGVDAGVLLGDLDATFQFDRDLECETVKDEIELMMPFVGLNFHLTPDSRADVFIGPFVGFLSYDDETFVALGEARRVDFDSETTLGVVLGVDLPFQRDGKWALTGAIRYVPTSAQDGTVDLDVDPTVTTLGLAYRF